MREMKKDMGSNGTGFFSSFFSSGFFFFFPQAFLSFFGFGGLDGIFVSRICCLFSSGRSSHHARKSCFSFLAFSRACALVGN